MEDACLYVRYRYEPCSPFDSTYEITPDGVATLLLKKTLIDGLGACSKFTTYISFTLLLRPCLSMNTSSEPSLRVSGT